MSSEYVTCEVCNQTFKRITSKHLAQHDMTLDEYKKEFPNSPTVSDALRERFATNNESFWIKQHGEELGKQKYAEYKKMLANKNTFEAKHEKYGWSREQFNEYNATRAQTESNMIKRYGLEEGTKKWQAYCELQAYAGCSLQYFIDKLGPEDGRVEYERINKEKSQSLRKFIERYGRDVGLKRFEQKYANSHKTTTSEDERNFVNIVTEHIDSLMPNVWEFRDYRNGQIMIPSIDYAHGFFYDLVIQNGTKKLCIEFNGDYYHRNPEIYGDDPSRNILGITTSEVWERDKLREQVAKQAGYDVIVIWESDWKKDPQGCVQRIIDSIEG